MTAGFRESSPAATAWGHYDEGRGGPIEMDQTGTPIMDRSD